MSNFTAHRKADGRPAEIRMPQDMLLELIRRPLDASDLRVALAVLFRQYQFNADASHAQAIKVEELMEVLALSRRTVFYSIERLQAVGILYRTAGRGRGAANAYRITDPHVWLSPERVQHVAPKAKAGKGATDCTPGVQRVAQKGATGDQKGCNGQVQRPDTLSNTSTSSTPLSTGGGKEDLNEADRGSAQREGAARVVIQELDVVEALRRQPEGMTTDDLFSELRQIHQTFQIDYEGAKESLRRLVDQRAVREEAQVMDRRGVAVVGGTGRTLYILDGRHPKAVRIAREVEERELFQQVYPTILSQFDPVFKRAMKRARAGEDLKQVAEWARREAGGAS